MAQLAPTEIRALSKIIDELDYYQLLHVRRGANAREVKAAYYASSRSFHPDANRQLAADLREAVARIAKRVTEAYAVLRDPRRRQAYDHLVDEKRGIRIQLSQAQAEAGKQALENEGRTAQGRQYHRMARTAIERGDWSSASRNLQTALTFEPGNETFTALLEEARAKLK